MDGFVNRRANRFHNQLRRATVRASLACESLEGRQLLSGGFSGGGMGGMGFGGDMGRREFGSAEMANLGGGASSQGGFGSNRNFFANSGGSPTTLSFSNTFANGSAGNNTPFRPYMGWDDSQPTATGTTTTSSSDGTTTAAPTSATASTTATPTNAIPSNPAANSGSPGFMMNGGGGFGFMGSGNVGEGGRGFMMGGSRGDGEGTSGANPFDLNSGSTTASAVQTAFDALKTELKNDLPTDAKPSYASIGTLMDDLDAIRSGTLTGTAATSQVQTDEAAALAAIGVTADQITTIQTDEAALVTAINAANASSTSGSTTSTTAYDPLTDTTDVPLLPFLTQLRQNDSIGSRISATSTTSSSTSSTSTT